MPPKDQDEKKMSSKPSYVPPKKTSIRSKCQTANSASGVRKRRSKIDQSPLVEIETSDEEGAIAHVRGYLEGAGLH
jgi:hypothetical protein